MKRLEDITADDVAQVLNRLLESRQTEAGNAVPYLTVELLEYLGTAVQGPLAQQFLTDLTAGKPPREAHMLAGNAAPALIFHLGLLAGRELTESDQFASIMGGFEDGEDTWAREAAALALENAVAAEPEGPEEYRILVPGGETQIFKSRARCTAAAQEIANTQDIIVVIEERKFPEADPEAGWNLIDSARPQEV